MYSEFNRKLPIYASTSHYLDTFKPDVYVSQLHFNVTNKVAKNILYSTKVSQWKSQMNLMNSQ